MTDLERRLRSLGDAARADAPDALTPDPGHRRRIRMRRALSAGVGSATLIALIAGATFFLGPFRGRGVIEIGGPGNGGTFERMFARVATNRTIVLELDAESGTICYTEVGFFERFTRAEIFRDTPGGPIVPVSPFRTTDWYEPRGGGRCLTVEDTDALQGVIDAPREHGLRLVESDGDTTIAPLLPQRGEVEASARAVPDAPADRDKPLGSGIWPANTHEGIETMCRTRDDIGTDSGLGVALDFSLITLGWTEASSTRIGPGPGGHGQYVDVESDEGPRLAVLTEMLRPGCWFVVSVTSPSADDDAIERIEIEGRDGRIVFDPDAAGDVSATSVTADIGYGDAIVATPSWERGAEPVLTWEMTKPKESGHFLVMFRDGNGEVFAAIGGILRSGTISID